MLVPKRVVRTWLQLARDQLAQRHAELLGEVMQGRQRRCDLAQFDLRYMRAGVVGSRERGGAHLLGLTQRPYPRSDGRGEQPTWRRSSAPQRLRPGRTLPPSITLRRHDAKSDRFGSRRLTGSRRESTRCPSDAAGGLVDRGRCPGTCSRPRRRGWPAGPLGISPFPANLGRLRSFCESDDRA